MCVCVCVYVLHSSVVSDTLQLQSLCSYITTIIHQAPLPMEFSRQEYKSGVQFPTPGDVPNQGCGLHLPALAGRFFTTSTVWEAFSQDNPCYCFLFSTMRILLLSLLPNPYLVLHSFLDLTENSARQISVFSDIHRSYSLLYALLISIGYRSIGYGWFDCICFLFGLICGHFFFFCFVLFLVKDMQRNLSISIITRIVKTASQCSIVSPSSYQ